MSVARPPQLGPQLAQFPPQFFELLAEVGCFSSVGLAFAATRVALRMFTHQLLGPLPDFVGQIGQAGRVEMPGGHLQVLGPFFRRQITPRTGILRPAPLRTRSLEVGTLGAGTKRTASLRPRTLGPRTLRTGALRTLRATGPLVGTTGAIRAIA